jgi:hypothetical protein
MVGEVTLQLEPAELRELYAEVLTRAAADPRSARKRPKRTRTRA